MKKLIASCALLGAGFAHAQGATYTLADVQAHATANDCWMILNTDKVYDFTNFISSHPGGNSMVAYCGKDGTAAFANIGHSSSAVAMEAQYLIGTLTSATAAVSVTLSPANASLAVGGTVQFTPTVKNSTAGVAWTVTPATLGSISANGLFTALTAGQGTVSAASVQDGTKSASAVVTVNATPPSSGGGGSSAITVSVNPSAVTLSTGSHARFRAHVGNSSQGVTWSVSGAIGTIDKRGVLSAATTPATGTVTATSVEDPTKTATVQVTLTAATCSPARITHDGRDGSED